MSSSAGGGIRKLYPGEMAESVYAYDFDGALKKGIKGVLFDIDNTLVPHDAPADDRARALMEELRARGLSLGLVSNNHEPRVKSFSEACGGLDYVFLSHKPKPDAYLRLRRKLGLSASQVIFFGDQLFTDIWGANNAGIHSILVEPIDKSTDIPRIKLKRQLEKPILCLYKKRFFL